MVRKQRNVGSQGQGAPSAASPARIATEATTPLKRRRLSEEERRRQIIQDVKIVFLQHGYDGSRTKDLAKAAGVTEATLFAYFRSKDELFEAVIMDPLKESILASQDERVTAYLKAATEDEKYQVTVSGIYRFLETFQRIYPMLSIALFSGNKRGDAFYKQHFGKFLTRAINAGERMVPEGSGNTVTAETLVLLMFGFSFSEMTDAWFRERTLDLRKLSEEYGEILLYGLRGKQRMHELEVENAKLRRRLEKLEKR